MVVAVLEEEWTEGQKEGGIWHLQLMDPEL